MRVNDPDAAPAPALPVADAVEPPVNIRVMTVMATAATSAIPAVTLPLDPKRNMEIPPEVTGEAGRADPMSTPDPTWARSWCEAASAGVGSEMAVVGSGDWPP